MMVPVQLVEVQIVEALTVRLQGRSLGGDTIGPGGHFGKLRDFRRQGGGILRNKLRPARSLQAAGGFQGALCFERNLPARRFLQDFTGSFTALRRGNGRRAGNGPRIPSTVRRRVLNVRGQALRLLSEILGQAVRGTTLLAEGLGQTLRGTSLLAGSGGQDLLDLAFALRQALGPPGWAPVPRQGQLSFSPWYVPPC